MTAKFPVYPRQQVRLTTRIGNWLLGTNAAVVFGFLYLPVLILIVFSFNNTRSVAVFSGFSTEWYRTLSQNTELLEAAKNSLLVGFIATVVATAIGTLTALAMDRYRFKLRTTFDANLYLPIVIPEIVMGISLLLFFNQAFFPLLNEVFPFFHNLFAWYFNTNVQIINLFAGILNLPLMSSLSYISDARFTTGLPTIMVSHIAFDIPFVYVIVRARLADFDRTLEEAAADLGADEWQTFKRVTLPLLMPGIIGGALMAFTLSLDDYLITVFTKGVQEQTMPLYIYSLVRRGVTPEINALSSVLLAGSIGLVGLSLTAQNGGPVYTKGMSLGAGIGLGFFGLLSLPSLFAPSAFTVGRLILQLALLSAFYFTWRSYGSFREELADANRSGRMLAWFTVFIAGFAAYLSAWLLLS